MRFRALAAVLTATLLLGACGSASEPTSTTGPPAGSERHVVFTHCGWYETLFAGVLWTPSSIPRGSFPDGTDPIATEGTAIRDGDRLLFTADSDLEVVFVIAPPDLPEPPPCD